MKSIQFIICAFLVGCSQNVTNVTGVCKSCQPYKVRGSWYTPQLYYEYYEYGKASWYGPGFHGKQKATGEKYNQNALTAAHRTLPLPTVVVVRNIKNGKSIKLVVDDRGPYTYAGRIIDLSVAAAKKIGTYETGLGNVLVCSDVKESKALSNFLYKYGTRGLTYRQVYDRYISGKCK